ncbi:putative diguanylate cyclase YegE [Roseovarius albus]|uniref:guanylate cyclase n=1 Tax=Roseovarius albus TaxID=1247867 RepID=A0A1X6YJ83_9RHOB|nr:diguanylate cyclase [Roseovarius albus]SLN22404.1 putative diguanylate cyclase YegE [Roseovarius albus]
MTSNRANLNVDVLDAFCPLHVVVNKSGHITQAGRAFHKLCPGQDAVNRRILEVLEIKRPGQIYTLDDLLEAVGTKLHLQVRNEHRTELKGLMVPLPNGGGAVLNLSFGISVVEAVCDYELTNADFAPTDLAIELLYMAEAQSAALSASKKMNLRLQEARMMAEEQAFTDTLTGLKNRRALEPILERLIDREQDFALMHLDLDFFKAVNDVQGHAAGDQVLKVVAKRMCHETRPQDSIVRTGGDEFVIVLPGLKDAAQLDGLATRLIISIEGPITFENQLCKVSASIGTVLSLNYDSPEIDRMMDDADVALYGAKREGRGCHVTYRTALRLDDTSDHSADDQRAVS